jgi:hypothetical protein
VPTGFRLGGVFQNLGLLPFQGPPKIFFRKAKIFPENVGEGGGVGCGGMSTLFFENKSSRNLSQNKKFFPEISKIFSEEILHFWKILQFQHTRAASPQVGPPFFTFWGGAP